MGNLKKSRVEDREQNRPPKPTDLWFSIHPKQWPIVYRDEYNVRFGGLEKFHPFDANKWGNIYKFLKEDLNLTEDIFVRPLEATSEDLLLVHTRSYLDSLKWGYNVAAIAEVPSLIVVPNFFIQRYFLRPMRFQTGGSILAGKLALERGWAINIGGGFHHCSANKGGGFCVYADITLLIKFLFKYDSHVQTAMIVDLDAHQGNGYETDFLGQEDVVFIMDVYNYAIYPNDQKAKAAIRCKVEFSSCTQDADYLDCIERKLEKSLRSFHPDILVYNAGTDILEGDRLGHFCITPQGIIRRDQIVFMKARERRIPIVMLLSGGYQKNNARIIADSIINLYEQGLITEPKQSL